LHGGSSPPVAFAVDATPRLAYRDPMQLDDLDLEAAIAAAEFRSALRRFLRKSELVADGCGLTPQRYLLLLMIKGASDGSERSTVTELGQRLQLAQSTVTELVTRSVDAGLLAREGSEEDGRVTWVRLTPEGERRLACAFRGLDSERQALLDALGALGPLKA
jgi:DNA-binding MarR family transcriptional regulator